MSDYNIFESMEDISIDIDCFQNEEQQQQQEQQQPKKIRMSWTEELHHYFLISILKLGFNTVCKEPERYQQINISNKTFFNLKHCIDNIYIDYEKTDYSINNNNNNNENDILHHKNNNKKALRTLVLEKDLELEYKNESTKDIKNQKISSDFENKFISTFQAYDENSNICSIRNNIAPIPITINDYNKNNNNNNTLKVSFNEEKNKEEEDDDDDDENSNDFIERELDSIDILKKKKIKEESFEFYDLESRSYSLDDDFIDYLYNIS